MVSAPSFSGLGALVVCAFVFATVVRCPGGLLAAGNFAVAAVLESASGSCWARVIGTKQQVRAATETRREVRTNATWRFIVYALCRLQVERRTTSPPGNRLRSHGASIRGGSA